MQSGSGCTRVYHLVSAPANYAGKQQTTYLFGKENIHQATVEDEVKPIWRHCKVTFLSEVGEFSAPRWDDVIMVEHTEYLY